MPQQGVAFQHMNSKQSETNREESKAARNLMNQNKNRTSFSETSPQICQNRKVAKIRQGIMEAR